jgi:aspartate-semialdehyde dehydrogenase
MIKKLRVGVVGATGMVGKVFMQLLDERKFPLEELRPFASEASLGKKVICQNREFEVQVLTPGCFKGLDVVFFSSGDDISKEWAPLCVADGAWAIDNSAAFRMDPKYNLVVPEVNGHLVNKSSDPNIIANPNCSTIQLVVALKPLFDQFGLSEVRVSSYQAVSGAGQVGYDELMEQVGQFTEASENYKPQAKVFSKPILFNCVPQIGSFNEFGYSSEEVKIMNETKKILNTPELKISAFTVRVPVLNAHSETVWVTLNKEISKEQITNALRLGQGLVVEDNPRNSEFPTPFEVSGKDPVYVGRIHQDMTDKKTWLMWVVSDNIKKGAALNGIQIAEKLFQM